jgi:hypothetical protein
MIIINYWQQVSKRYFLSHLFLGVMAAGFGLTTNTVAISSAPVNSTVTIITIAVIAKASLQDGLHSIAKVVKGHWLFSSQRTKCIDAITHFTSYIFYCHLLPIKGYALANAIRAGPDTHSNNVYF